MRIHYTEIAPKSATRLLTLAFLFCSKSNEGDRKTTPDPTVSYEDDFEDDVPLTETAAYLKMMSSAHSEPDDDISDLLGNSGPQKQDSEADDDVERELARTISPPVTSPRQRSPNNLKTAKQKPKLSLFETGTEVEKAEKDLGDSWGGSSVKSVKSDISDSESVVSPPLSPDFGVGYTPTALENNEPSNKVDKENDKSEPKSASDSKAKRKTGNKRFSPDFRVFNNKNVFCQVQTISGKKIHVPFISQPGFPDFPNGRKPICCFFCKKKFDERISIRQSYIHLSTKPTACKL